LPPNVYFRIAKGKDFKQKDEDSEAIHFFHFIYPRLLAAGLIEKRFEFI